MLLSVEMLVNSSIAAFVICLFLLFGVTQNPVEYHWAFLQPLGGREGDPFMTLIIITIQNIIN